MMENKSYSKRILSANHPKYKTKLSEGAKKLQKNHSRCSDAHKQIPKIITELQKNIKLLKKCYEEDENRSICFGSVGNVKKKIRPRSIIKTKSHARMPQLQNTTSPQIDEIKKSFLHAHGYESTNVVELYNFYKKSIVGSTRIYGSMSMENANSLNNNSQIKEQEKREKSENYELKKIQEKKGLQTSTCVTNLIKNGCQLVNVASLLAQKKKVLKKSEEKSTPNFQQCKRKLVKPNTNDNIERFNQTKENLRLENKGKVGEMKYFSDPKEAMKKILPDEKIEEKIVRSPKNISSLLEEKKETTISPSIQKINSSRRRSSSKKKSSEKKNLNQGILFGFLNSTEKQKAERQEIQIRPYKTNEEQSFLGSQIEAKSCSRVLDLEDIPFQF